MNIFYITLISFWVHPALTLIIVRLLRNSTHWKKFVLVCSFNIIIFFAFFVFDISTVNINIDFLITSFIYFCFWIIIWNALYFEKGLFKTLCLIFLFSLLIFNYCSSTAGILAIGFTLYDWETTQELKIDTDLTYKETPLGNAISDYRGKKIDIFKQFSVFPFLEYPYQSKSFFEIAPYRNILNVEYNKSSRILFLSAQDTLSDSIMVWQEKIFIK